MSDDDNPKQWIAAACRRAREESGIRRSSIANGVGRGEDVIRKFETLRGQWSPITGEIVNTYSDLTGVPAWELWQIAIDDWKAAQEKVAADHSQQEQDTPDVGSSLRRSSAAGPSEVSDESRQPRQRGGR